MAFLTPDQLLLLGFKSIGENVNISDKASIYNAANIEIGSHVRIDDFCILSAGIDGICIGNHVHIACYSFLIGAARITLHDFSNISSRVSVYSSNDDYSGQYLCGPTVPQQYRNVTNLPVTLESHSLVGSTCVILPGITLKEGSAVGAMSLVVKDCQPWSIYAGSPAKKIKNRNDQCLEHYAKFKN